MQAARTAGLPAGLCPQIQAWQQRAWRAFKKAQEDERKQMSHQQAAGAVQVRGKKTENQEKEITKSWCGARLPEPCAGAAGSFLSELSCCQRQHM